MLLPSNDPEFTDDELLEPITTLSFVLTVLWLVAVLLVLTPLSWLAALRQSPVPEFADPLRKPTDG